MTDHTLETHGYGFSEDGDAVGVSQFPFDEVADRLDGVESSPSYGDAAVAVREVLSWVLTPQRGVIRRDGDGAWIRLLAIAWVWRHPSMHDIESVRMLAKTHKTAHRTLADAVEKYAKAHGIPAELVRKRSGPYPAKPHGCAHRQDEPAADRRRA